MKQVVLHEVGPRDGLQMEKEVAAKDKKLEWLRALATTGLDMIQVGSFVHPKRMPQMADTDEIFKDWLASDAPPPPGVVLTGLILNEKGLDRALACGCPMICAGVSASETHSQKNTGMTVAESTAQIVGAAKRALAEGLQVQVSVQSAFGCGYEGAIAPEKVMDIVKRYVEAGLRVISLADTMGQAGPTRVEDLFGAVLSLDTSIECACHFHDTQGLGLVNCQAAMRAGVKYFESAFAGLGGCPFTTVAGGNVCTEDWVNLLQKTGARREVDLATLVEIARDVAAHFGREMPGSLHKVWTGTKTNGETT